MHPNFSGRWTARLDESRFVNRVPLWLTAEIVQSEDHLHCQMRMAFEDSGDSRITFDASIVGGDEVRQGSVALVRRMGDDLLIELSIESGGREVILRDRWWLSANRQRLTMAHKDDVLAGQTVVFERQD